MRRPRKNSRPVIPWITASRPTKTPTAIAHSKILLILASESKMFSGAEIKEAVNTGFIAAFNGGKREVKTEDILNAIRSTVPISCTMKEQLVKMRDWQEGRAVRASSIKPEEIIDIADYRKKQKNKTKESDLDPVEMLGL